MSFSLALKLAIKKKAHFRCCLCHELGVEVHHIIPQEDKGPDTEDNAPPLCPSCHETYGANPTKRKFITEARDFWYEVCAKRYATDPDRLDKIESRISKTATKDDVIGEFEQFRQWIEQRISNNDETRRDEKEVLEALDVTL